MNSSSQKALIDSIIHKLEAHNTLFNTTYKKNSTQPYSTFMLEIPDCVTQRVQLLKSLNKEDSHYVLNLSYQYFMPPHIIYNMGSKIHKDYLEQFSLKSMENIFNFLLEKKYNVLSVYESILCFNQINKTINKLSKNINLSIFCQNNHLIKPLKQMWSDYSRSQSHFNPKQVTIGKEFVSFIHMNDNEFKKNELHSVYLFFDDLFKQINNNPKHEANLFMFGYELTVHYMKILTFAHLMNNKESQKIIDIIEKIDDNIGEDNETFYSSDLLKKSNEYLLIKSKATYDIIHNNLNDKLNNKENSNINIIAQQNVKLF